MASKRRANSPLLIHEEPLQVLPSLAVKYGLNEAIILQQLHYWLKRSTHIRDEKPWVYNSYKQWQEQFPFWSARTIERAIISLQEAGVVIAANFNNSPIDKTKWYTIDYEKLNGDKLLEDISTTQNVSSTTQNVSSTTQNVSSTTQNVSSTTQNVSCNTPICVIHDHKMCHRSLSDDRQQDDEKEGIIENSRARAYPETTTETTTEEKTPVSTSVETSPTPHKRSRRVPRDFEITADLKAWAAAEVPDVDIKQQTAILRDHEFKNPHSDWPAVWRNWMRRAAKDLENSRAPSRTSPQLSAAEKQTRERFTALQKAMHRMSS